MQFILCAHSLECTLGQLDDSCTLLRVSTEEGKTTLSSNDVAGFNRIIGLNTIQFDGSSFLEEISDGSFNYFPSVTSIIFDEGCKITKIGSNFNGFPLLQEIDLNNLQITEIKTCFNNCPLLSSIKLGATVNSISSEAFVNSPQVKSISVAEGSPFVIDNGVLYSQTKEQLIYYPPLLDADLVLPDEFTGFAYTIPKFAQIKSLTVNKENCDFQFCILSLESITFGSKVTSICENAFNGCLNLKQITFGEKVALIGAKAFANTGVTDVTIPTTVTSIGDFTFQNCTSLNSVTSSILSIGIFSGCISLEKVTLSSISEISERSFEKCYKLQKISIPDSVTAINEYAFSESDLSLGVEFSKTSLLTQIKQGAFDDTFLKSFTIPPKVTLETVYSSFFAIPKSFNTDMNDQFSIVNDNLIYNDKLVAFRGKVDRYVVSDDISVIFSNCFKYGKSLVTLDLGKVTEIQSNAFSGLIMDNLVIPATVKTIDSLAFENSMIYNINVLPGDLKELSISNANGILSLSIEEGVESFSIEYCKSLFQLNLPKSLKEIKSFNDLPSLLHLLIPSSVTSLTATFVNCDSVMDNYVTFNGTLLFYPPRNETEVFNVPSDVHTIGTFAFSHCKFLKYVTFSSVKAINEFAFYECDALTNVTISNEVTILPEGTFVRCPKLTQVKMVTDSQLTEMTDAFVECFAIEELDFPINAVVEVRAFFEFLPNLKNINVFDNHVEYKAVDGMLCDKNGKILYCPYNLQIEKVTLTSLVDNQAFAYTHGVKSVTVDTEILPYGCFSYSDIETVTITKKIEKIEALAFCECKYLKIVTFEDGIEKLTELRMCVFNGCTSLSDLTLPDSIVSASVNSLSNTGLKSFTFPTKLTTIAVEMFRGCEKLTTITIPKSVTEIGARAFFGCSSLTSVTIEGVTIIPIECFRKCEKLTSFDGKSVIKEIHSGAFDETRLTSFTITKNIEKIDGSFLYKSHVTSIVSESDFYTFENNMIVEVQTGKIIKVFDASELKVTGEIDQNAIVECQNLKSVDFMKSDITSLPNLPSSLSKVYLPPTIKVLPNIDIETTIASPLFTTFNSIIIDQKMSIIGTFAESVTCDFALSISHSYTAKTINAKSVITIENNAFIDSSLETINSPLIHSIGYSSFKNCKSLVTINIPSHAKIDRAAFSGSSLKSVAVFQNFISESEFENCDRLESVTMPNVRQIHRRGFAGCQKLTTITLPQKIEEEAFANCDRLQTVVVKDDSEYSDSSFDNCTSLSEVTLTDDQIYLAKYLPVLTYIINSTRATVKDGVLYYDSTLFAYPKKRSDKQLTLLNEVTGVYDLGKSITSLLIDEGSQLKRIDADISDLEKVSIGVETEYIKCCSELSKLKELIVWGYKSQDVFEQFKHAENLETIRVKSGLDFDISGFASDVKIVYFDDHGGLSNTALALIIVGVVLFVLIVTGGVVAFLMIRRKKATEKALLTDNLIIPSYTPTL